MAQRAYRQREETTLEDLRQQVCGLTTTVECMNKSFEDFRDRLVSANLSQSGLDELAEVSVLFAGFLKAAQKPEHAHTEALVGTDSTALHSTLSSRQPESPPSVPNGDHMSSRIDQTTLHHAERPSQQSDIGLGYKSISPRPLD
jgi:hypothetical protein